MILNSEYYNDLGSFLEATEPVSGGCPQRFRYNWFRAGHGDWHFLRSSSDNFKGQLWLRCTALKVGVFHEYLYIVVNDRFTIDLSGYLA